MSANSILAKKQLEDALIAKGRWAGLKRRKRFVDSPVGERCICWNEEYGQAETDCKLCFGTGFAGGGYYSTELIRVDFADPRDSWKQFDYGQGITGSVNMVTTGDPMIEDNDLIALVSVNAVEEIIGVIRKFKIQDATHVLLEGDIIGQKITMVNMLESDQGWEVWDTL